MERLDSILKSVATSSAVKIIPVVEEDKKQPVEHKNGSDELVVMSRTDMTRRISETGSVSDIVRRMSETGSVGAPADDDERKKQRRERNKQAAARCRKRRMDLTSALQVCSIV